jgi:ketosteroid isomerase-like protein
VCGREELRGDFLKGFEAFSIEQDVSNPELVVRGRWAFEISEVESGLTPRRGGEVTHVRSTTVVALNQQSDGSWKVGRVLGLVQQ